MRSKRTMTLAVLLLALLVPFLFTGDADVPVRAASAADWNPQSFWYEPWGVSGVHKGIDIFAPEGRPVLSPVNGIVVFRGQLALGGNVVAVLGARWRIHYLAHLQSSDVALFDAVARGEEIARVGTSGNAAGKPPHLHYAVVSAVPLPWQATRQSQGWRRMFYLDPGQVLSDRGAP